MLIALIVFIVGAIVFVFAGASAKTADWRELGKWAFIIGLIFWLYYIGK